MTVTARWVRFSCVGAIGIVVQLAVLTALLHGLGWHYVPATALAVEAAVLHNFWWHQVWTWGDRPSESSGGTARRLMAFHMVNGFLSLAGNVALVALLVQTMGVGPLLGNVIAIAACSAVTFAACEWRVFARAGAVALLLVAVEPTAIGAAPRVTAEAGAADLSPARLHPDTEAAWRRYTAEVASRHDGASATSTPFFALDAFAVTGWREAARAGQVPAHEFDRARAGGADIPVPHGAIHHWTGAIFLRDATLPELLERVRQLSGDEARYYDDVLDSRRLEQDGDRARVFMKLRRTKIVTVTYNTEHAVEYRRLGADRATVQSIATRIAELEHAGTPREREMMPGDDHGYLWRLNAYWRYQATDGGVLIECESVSLSRRVPALLRPFLSGIVDGLARESLERTLEGLRRALTMPAPRR